MSLDEKKKVYLTGENKYGEKDVKQFIEKLKDILTMDGFGHCVHENCDSIVKQHILRDIDKLAGKGLI